MTELVSPGSGEGHVSVKKLMPAIDARPEGDRSAKLQYFVAVVATGSAFFMIILDTSIVNLALPRIEREFGADLAMLQ